MTLKTNVAGLEHAKQLINDGLWALNTQWSANQPSPESEARYLAQHGEADYARWFLVQAEEGYKFPIGDFRKVHRSGVMAARRYAEQNQLEAIVEAADEILDLFDRMNAC